jgi:hypothetical protein
MLAEHIQWILILTGALTAGAAATALVPRPALGFVFGESPTGAVTLLFVRHWGLVVAGVGVLLVWSAFSPSLREPVLIFASVEKIALALPILMSSLRQHRVAMAIASGDLLIAILYLAYLLGIS